MVVMRREMHRMRTKVLCLLGFQGDYEDQGKVQTTACMMNEVVWRIVL